MESGSANVLIEVFDDRVVISNPGGLPGGLKPSDFGTKSVARNQLIASLLHRIDFIEKVGTGISRIRDAVRENGKSTVEFSYDDFFTVTYYRGKREVDGGLGETSEKATQKTTQKTTRKTTQKLTEKQNEILHYLEKNPGAGRNEMNENIENITLDGIKYNLRRLQDIGRLKRIGPDKGGYWEVVKNDEK